MAPFHKNGDEAHPEHNLHLVLGSQFRNDIMMHWNQSMFYQSSISNITPKRQSKGVQRLLWHYWRSGHIPIAAGACFPPINTQHFVGKLAAMCNSPTLTVWVDNATCSDCKFLRRLCWGIWVFPQFSPGKHHNTTKSHRSSGKGAHDFQKVQDGTKLFPVHPICEHTFNCWGNTTRILHWRVWRLP